MTLHIDTRRILRGVLALAHLINLLLPQIPLKYKGTAMVVLLVCQWTVSEIGANSNPDGTPVAQAYVPGVKKDA